MDEHLRMDQWWVGYWCRNLDHLEYLQGEVGAVNEPEQPLVG